VLALMKLYRENETALVADLRDGGFFSPTGFPPTSSTRCKALRRIHCARPRSEARHSRTTHCRALAGTALIVT
jgi:hypothetical protein